MIPFRPGLSIPEQAGIPMKTLTHLSEIVNPNTEVITVKPSGILMKIRYVLYDFFGVLSAADAEAMKEAFIRAFLL